MTSGSANLGEELGVLLATLRSLSFSISETKKRKEYCDGLKRLSQMMLAIGYTGWGNFLTAIESTISSGSFGFISACIYTSRDLIGEEDVEYVVPYMLYITYSLSLGFTSRARQYLHVLCRLVRRENISLHEFLRMMLYITGDISPFNDLLTCIFESMRQTKTSLPSGSTQECPQMATE